MWQDDVIIIKLKKSKLFPIAKWHHGSQLFWVRFCRLVGHQMRGSATSGPPAPAPPSLLMLRTCESLPALPPSLGALKNLKTLRLQHCQNLKWLPDSVAQLLCF